MRQLTAQPTCPFLSLLASVRSFRLNSSQQTLSPSLMKKRAGAVSIAYTFSIGLSALAVAWLPSVARAQSADLVLCDRVAAEPADPDKHAGGRGGKENAP